MSAKHKYSKLWGAPLVAIAVLLSGPPVAAQSPIARCEDDAPSRTLRENIDGVPQNACVERTGFRLFGTADFAGTGMRSAAPDVFYFTTNTGFSDTGAELQGETLPFGTLGTAISPGGYQYQNFELQFWAAAARGDWLRNRDIASSLQNVTGGGWTYIMNTQRLGGFHQWSGHDGSVGVTHSGLQSAVGAGCLDHGGGYPGYPYGFPLLATFDCPESWGSDGWQGRQWIGPIDNWIEYFNGVGPAAFNFDFWRVPDQYVFGKPTIGDFQTYGTMSDHGREKLEFYGNVVPGGSGDPQLEGYPIGLDVHFNAYSFRIPSVSRGFIYEGLIVNNSQEVYGVPLDYDSLFFGMLIRPLRNIGGGRRANPHAVPELGAVLHNELGRTVDCDGALPVPQSIDCSSPRGRTPGFSGGGQGHIFLKTPLGDLRNKHFTDPTSPFFAPSHPNAGDTITFNRMSMCDFRCAIQQFIFDARKGYGILAALPSAALDGRDPADLSPFERWGLFKGQYYAPDGSELLCDPNNPRQPGCFGYRVPGDWSYTNRPPGTPPGPDTLFFDNCRPPTSPHPGANQCTALWADTLPDKVLNWTQNVIWPGAGPFPLAAGDTTSWVVVTFAAPDSAGLMASLEAFYNFYLTDFYLGPGLPSPPNIASVVAQGGQARLGEPSITLFLDDAAETWKDDFAIKALGELRNPVPGTIFDKVVRADPTAADELEAQINSNNVDTVYVFKSCDDARSFTSDRSNWECTPSPARNTTGEAIGVGWEAYAVLTPSNGSFPTLFTDGVVASGREYLYTLVAHTPGIILDTQYWADTDGDGVEDEIRDTTLTIVPPGRSVLSVNPGDSFVTEVYVPASDQAGTVLPSAALVSRTGPIPFSTEQVAILLQRNSTAEGRYSLSFGSDATVTAYRQGTVVDSTVIQLEQSVLARLPSGALQDLVFDTVVYKSTQRAGLPLALDANATASTSMIGAVEVTVTELNSKAGILFNAAGEPLYASSRLSAGQFTPSQLLVHPNYPQFLVEIDDDPGAFVTDFWAIDGDDLRGRSDPSVEWLQGSSTPTGSQFGAYLVDWGATIFGDQPLLRIDVVNPINTRSDYANRLNSRAVISRTEVNQEILDAINRDIDPAIQLDELIDVGLPFTVRNLAFGSEDVGTPVRVAMFGASKLSQVLLGNAPDSATVDVPAGIWIPGEPLIFLEEVEVALTDASGVLQRDGAGQPVTESQLSVTWEEAVIGCADPRPTCNPVSGPRRAGIPGYVKVRANGDPAYPNGWDLNVVYKNPFNSQTSFVFDVSPTLTGSRIPRITRGDLDAIRVVPNPYIGRSAYEYVGDVRRLLFTHLPPRGEIEIFTASGQFIQRLQWEAADLQGSGDLFWNMQTREGNLIASGLYLFVVEATDPESGQYMKRLGKFIVIR